MRNNFFQGNAAQKMAIRHYDGPAMVLAGPGSGKTFVIVQRLKYLIEEKSVDPSSILVITFTKAAAIEMQSRFLNITDSSYPEVNFGTFHSVFYQIIRWSDSHNKKMNIASESFKQKIVSDILNSFAENDRSLKDEIEMSEEIIKDLLSEISRIKNSGLTCDDCDKSYVFSKYFKSIFDRYSNMLKEFDKIDFDDMICNCLKLLQDDEDFLKKCRDRYKYILIDEYQDINKVQFQVIEKLLDHNKNLFVVGDDDQSIYGFRGSDPEIMLSFNECFKEYDPHIIKLEINYRCGKKIIENSVKLINENKNRYRKNVVASENNHDGKIIPLIYSSKEKESKAILHFLDYNKTILSDIAIICRTNSTCLHLAGILKEHGIPTNLDRVSKSFLEDEGVLLIYNYLCFAHLGSKREHFYKIMNKPLRYISRESALKEIISEADVLRYYNGNKSMTEAIKKFFKHINMISHMRSALALKYIRKEIGIDKIYPKSIDAMDKLCSLALEYKDVKSFLKKLEKDFKDLEDKNIKASNVKGDCVKLMTMHGSKGLEFKIVWLPGLNEGVIPSRGATTVAQTEEERRMLYVAMTRAKEALIMSYLSGTKENPMLPSRFLRPVKNLWNEKYGYSSPSKPSSGSSIISSNSTSSR